MLGDAYMGGSPAESFHVIQQGLNHIRWHKKVKFYYHQHYKKLFLYYYMQYNKCRLLNCIYEMESVTHSLCGLISRQARAVALAQVLQWCTILMSVYSSVSVWNRGTALKFPCTLYADKIWNRCPLSCFSWKVAPCGLLELWFFVRIGPIRFSGWMS